MSMRVAASPRTLTMLAALMCVLVASRADAMARHLGIVPEPLGAKRVDALLVRYAVIGLETWDVVERELVAYTERIDRDATPRIDELFERYPHQHWMNWPGLKGEDAAFPNVLGTEPAIAARLRSAVDAGEPGSAEAEARFVAADDAVVARLIEVAVGAGAMTDRSDRADRADRTDRTPQELVALNHRLTALGDARRELADRATIRLRIAREEAQRGGQ